MFVVLKIENIVVLTYNRRLLLKPKDGLSQKIIDKCNESGLWIFAWTSKLDVKDIV